MKRGCFLKHPFFLSKIFYIFMQTTKIMSLALVEFLSDNDLIELAINPDLLESTRKAAQDEIDRRENHKMTTNDI